MSPGAHPTLPVTARAPAKLILSGEHSVVYGHPAVALAVNRWTTVHLAAAAGPTTVHSAEVDATTLLHRALTRELPAHGLRVTSQTDIPIGRGMGSSASLAVAVVRAHALATGETLDESTLYERAFAIERVFHGTPSGVDHGVIGRGGAVRFQRTPSGITLSGIDCPALPLVVFDTGIAGSTRDLVAGVRARKSALEGTLAAMGALTERVLACLAAPDPLDSLGPLLTENHRLLATLGVSTPGLDHLVDFALTHGALGAKLSGAGGGGVVIALTRSPADLLDKAHQAGLTAFSVDVVQPPGSPS